MNYLQRTLIAFAAVAACQTAWSQSGASVSSAGTLSASRQTPTNATQGATPRVFAPTMPRIAYSRYPWKTDIVATVFWVGEDASAGNATPNHKSAWDTNWAANFGGVDTPDASKRTVNYIPSGFVPKLNPFYVALPYNDLIDSSHTKPTASRIPWFKQRFAKQGRSVLKGQWLAIRFGMKVCYAQWEDVGPFETDDVDYVFGTSKPKNQSNNCAGIDLAPAVRDYLGMKAGNKVDWRFVDLNEIPEGPWRWFGTNNQFVTSRSSETAVLAARLEELRRMRDEYFKQYGNSAFRVR